ncbi:MAG TPA: FtsX-like permease family protein [Saprospiraceae bacterium]|nr:FtsX-like permease family protein [Saprospiraceae bacterium]
MNVSAFISKKSYASFSGSFTKTIIRISVAATALSLAVIIIAYAVFAGFQSDISKKVFGFWGHIHITDLSVNRSIEPVPIFVTDSLIRSIKEYDYKLKSSSSAIENVHPFAIIPGIINKEEESAGLFFKGLDQRFQWDQFKTYVKEGDVGLWDSSCIRQILISEQTALEHSWKPGDALILNVVSNGEHLKRKLKIAAIYKTGLEEYDKKFAIIHLDLIREILNWNQSQATGLEISVRNVAQAEQISQIIYDDILPMKYYSETIRNKFPNIFEWLALQDINKYFILGLVLLVCIINMIVMLLVLVLERVYLIGVLSSLGMRVSSIRKIFLYYSSYILFWGILLGNLLGVGFCLLQKKYKFIRLSEADYYLSHAPVSLELWPVLGLNILFFGLIVLVLILPSSFVAKIKPVESLKFR